MSTSKLIVIGLLAYLVLRPKEASASTGGAQLPAGQEGSQEGSAWLNFATSFLETVKTGIDAATKADAQPQAKP